MAVAGNTGGAGGARNVARATRKVKAKRANVYVPPAALAKPLAQTHPQAAAYVSQGRAVEKAANQANARQAAQRAAVQATSERKRAKRVEISALRKRTGENRDPTRVGGAPILVRRRLKLAQLDKAYAKAPVTPVAERQIKAKGETVKKGPQPLTSKPNTKERKVQEQNLERAAKSKDVIYSTDPAVLKKAGFAPEGISEEIARAPVKALVKGITEDVPELVATTPTSTYMLGKTAVTHPKKVPGMLAAPYKEFAKDPLKFATDKPVSTALMFYPGVKVPGRALGKAARIAGKQTLRGETKTLPGTALRQETTRSRSYFKNARQAREEAGKPPVFTRTLGRKKAQEPAPRSTRIKDKEIRRRVDEHYEYRRKYISHAEAIANHEARGKTKHLKGDERKQAIAEHVTAAREQADLEMRQRYAREFGATHRPAVSQAEVAAATGAHAEAKGAVTAARETTTKTRAAREKATTRAQAALHGQELKAARERTTGLEAVTKRGVPEKEADALRRTLTEHDVARATEKAALADREAARQTKRGIKRARSQGGIIDPATEGRLFDTKQDAGYVIKRMNEDPEMPNVTRIQVGDKWAVVPKTANDYLTLHKKVGTSQATGAKILRASRQKFTNAVLPLSPKWLSGQVVEGLIRANVHAGGPIGLGTGLVREHRLYNALEAKQKGLGDEFRRQALPGGHYGGQIQEYRTTRLHELFNEADDGKVGKVLAAVGKAGEKAPGANRIVNGWNRYTRGIFDTVNGRGIETPIQRAMLGRELKQSAFMERNLVGLSTKAVREAADGLHATETQVQFGRAIERAYGKYSNFSKAQRERNTHWTPFLPWYGNAIKFLAVVLPHDHPVLTAALASVNSATQKEREQMGLSLGDKNSKPLFLQGSVPVHGGKVVRVGHFTPFGIGEQAPGDSIVGTVLPQFSGTAKNMLGLDWTNKPLTVGSGFRGQNFTEAGKWGRAAATLAEAQVPGVGQASRITGVEPKLSGKKGETLFTGTGKNRRLRHAVTKEFVPGYPTASGGGGKLPKGYVKVPQVKVPRVKVPRVKVPPIKVG